MTRESMDTVTPIVIRNARLLERERPVNIRIEGGIITRISEEPLTAEGAEVYDADGGLASPPLVDPHIHLDAVLTEGFPQANMTGTLIEGIQRWSERKPYLTPDDVAGRAEEALRWHMVHGVLAIRTHVDVSDPSLTALKTLLTLRERMKPWLTLQIVAFPQDGIFCTPRGPELLEEAVRLGADAVGGIPHYEWTREDGLRDVELAFDLARRYQRAVDIHCDETDDDHSRFLETVANCTRLYHLQGRVTASHTTAMGSYNDAYAFKLLRLLARAQVHIVANPLDNIVLQGRFDTYPKRRGMTRVKELIEAGVTVAAGHDSIMDPWYPLGSGNQVFVASMLAHVGHLTGRAQLPWVWRSITEAGATVMELPKYGIREGAPASLVVFCEPTIVDVLRLMSRPRWVFSHGRLLAETVPAVSTVLWEDERLPVTFLRKDAP
ncbi:MAG: cytosine deaminase [Firmicutes bacterium]|nr:cytosine deaminase [Bacillota bacterium]